MSPTWTSSRWRRVFVNAVVYLADRRPAGSVFGYAADLAAALMSALGTNRVDVVVLIDKAYLEGMAKDQEQDVTDFRRMSEQGQDPDLKAWAARTLSTLESQLQQIKATQGRMGATR